MVKFTNRQTVPFRTVKVLNNFNLLNIIYYAVLPVLRILKILKNWEGEFLHG